MANNLRVCLLKNTGKTFCSCVRKKSTLNAHEWAAILGVVTKQVYKISVRRMWMVVYSSNRLTICFPKIYCPHRVRHTISSFFISYFIQMRGAALFASCETCTCKRASDTERKWERQKRMKVVVKNDTFQITIIIVCTTIHSQQNYMEFHGFAWIEQQKQKQQQHPTHVVWLSCGYVLLKMSLS